jgi:hypothetical protein
MGEGERSNSLSRASSNITLSYTATDAKGLLPQIEVASNRPMVPTKQQDDLNATSKSKQRGKWEIHKPADA